MILFTMTIDSDIFRICKLCHHNGSKARYRLGNATIYCCPRCDFHYLNHLDGSLPEQSVNLSDSGRRYITSRLSEGEHLHPLRFKLVQQHLDVTGTQTLDIGAGLGQFVLLLQQQGATAHGIEPSQLRRAYAQEQYGLNLVAELAHAPFWQTGYAGVFDLISLWDVIEHVDCPLSTLEDAVKLLKPGGLLCLDTPNREVFSYRLSQRIYDLSGGKLPLFLPSFYSTTRYGHKQIFTRLQICNLLEDCGLELLQPADTRGFPRNKLVLCARKKTPSR